MDFSDRLYQANGRLKVAQIRVRVQRLEGRLYPTGDSLEAPKIGHISSE